MGRLYTTMVVYTTIWPKWSYFGRLFNLKVLFHQKLVVFWSPFHSLHYNVDMYLSWFARVLCVCWSNSWKSCLLVAFLVILVVFFMLGWSYFGRIFTKSRSYFGRLFSNIWSYIYLTTLLLNSLKCRFAIFWATKMCFTSKWGRIWRGIEWDALI